MVSPLSEGFDLLQPHRLKRFQIIPVIVRRIINGLEFVQDLEDEALLSLLLPVFCQAGARENLSGSGFLFWHYAFPAKPGNKP
jgi:hypothetical protein